MAWFIEFSVPRRVYTYIGLFDQAARSTVRRSHPLGRLFGFGSLSAGWSPNRSHWNWADAGLQWRRAEETTTGPPPLGKV